ncbi:hypothetical protein [Microbacterium sp. Gd 4-13]|uniref:hypothetical protein n=1 Tax=Microbacterium sp. Gd 4-13 TaxID=2173179 RepID=UPI00197C7F07|nr:hypothetical protein [Microbacterium sp. Gd 4-13]
MFTRNIREPSTTTWTLPERWDVGDGEVRWGVYGEGEPLVLLHGTPFSSFIWRDIVPVLAPGDAGHDLAGRAVLGECDEAYECRIRLEGRVFDDRSILAGAGRQLDPPQLGAGNRFEGAQRVDGRRPDALRQSRAI